MDGGISAVVLNLPPGEIECAHEYAHQGLVYRFSSRNRPGSGARDVQYWDAYFCARCLAMEYRNRRVHGNSYERAIDGAVPAPSKARLPGCD